MPALLALPAAVTTAVVPFLLVLNDLDPTPEDEDVKAGFPALFLFLGLLAVVGLLGWSLVRHLRRAETNQRSGMFGDVPQQDQAADTETTDTTPQG
jgi:predicted permease